MKKKWKQKKKIFFFLLWKSKIFWKKKLFFSKIMLKFKITLELLFICSSYASQIFLSFFFFFFLSVIVFLVVYDQKNNDNPITKKKKWLSLFFWSQTTKKIVRAKPTEKKSQFLQKIVFNIQCSLTQILSFRHFQDLFVIFKKYDKKKPKRKKIGCNYFLVVCKQKSGGISTSRKKKVFSLHFSKIHRFQCFMFFGWYKVVFSKKK